MTSTRWIFMSIMSHDAPGCDDVTKPTAPPSGDACVENVFLRLTPTRLLSASSYMTSFSPYLSHSSSVAGQSAGPPWSPPRSGRGDPVILVVHAVRPLPYLRTLM